MFYSDSHNQEAIYEIQEDQTVFPAEVAADEKGFSCSIWAVPMPCL